MAPPNTSSGGVVSRIPGSQYRGTLSKELRYSINAMSPEQLRLQFHRLCEGNEHARKVAQRRLVIKGSAVIPYHKDLDSEDDSSSDSSEEDSEEVTMMTIGPNVSTSRYARCKNCKESFDVTQNKRGDCIWHLEKMEVLESADIWIGFADYVDFNEYQSVWDYREEGFIFPCCHTTGNHKGCMKTKHKAKVNTPAKPRISRIERLHQMLPLPIPDGVSLADTERIPRNLKPEKGRLLEGQKRRAEEELPRPVWKRCVREGCGERFDMSENEAKECRYHPGEKEVDYDCDFWADHDEECHGGFESFVDDPDMASGFMWSCCQHDIEAEGCAMIDHLRPE